MKIGRKISYVFLLGAAIGMQAMPVLADETGLSLTQKVEHLSATVQEQEYTVSYESDGITSYEGGTKLKMDFGDGFTPASLHIGDWSDYEEVLTLSVYGTEEVPLFRGDAAENSVIELGSYTDVQYVTIQTEGAAPATMNIKEFTVTGEIDTKISGDSLKTTLEYSGRMDATEDYTVIGTKEIETDCKVYALHQPVVTLSTNTLNQLDSLEAVVNAIGGEGTLPVDYFTVNMKIPSRMITDRIILPEFEGGDISLFIDGSERKINPDGTYNVGSRISEIQLTVKTQGQIKQLKDMKVEMRNTSSSAGEEFLQATVNAVFADGATQMKESEKVSFTCLESEIPDPDPEPEPEPDPEPQPDPDPDVPIEPENPNPDVPVEPDVPVVPSNPDDGKEEQKEENKKPDKIVDLSGLNLQSARADGKDTVIASVEQSDEYRTRSLQAANNTKIQETKVFDFTSDTVKDKKDEKSRKDTDEKDLTVAVLDDKEDKPAEEISKTPVEKAKHKIQESVVENRAFPIVLLVIAVLIAATGIIIFIMKDRKKTEPADDLANMPGIVYPEAESPKETDETEEKKPDDTSPPKNEE